VGGRKTVALADGSIIDLNTDTRIRVSDDGQKRHVKLDKGEAFFQVRHDPKHPFVVIAGNRRIVDLGTKFSVRVDGDDVSVTVQEGHVRVENIGHPDLSAPVDLRQDVELIASADTTMLTRRSPAQVDQTLGWRSGMLIFTDETLADVVAEFNRYNDRKMEISDGEIANTKIAGSFQATNVRAFIRLLRRAFGFQVEESGDRIIISD
jgi:transmembrane sensor